MLCITSILLVGGTFMFIFGIYKLSTEFNYICEDNNYYQRNGICFYYGCPSCDYYTKIATKQTILAPGLPLLIFGILCKIAGTVFLQKTYKFYHDNNGKWFDWLINLWFKI